MLAMLAANSIGPETVVPSGAVVVVVVAFLGYLKTDRSCQAKKETQHRTEYLTMLGKLSEIIEANTRQSAVTARLLTDAERRICPHNARQEQGEPA